MSTFYMSFVLVRVSVAMKRHMTKATLRKETFNWVTYSQRFSPLSSWCDAVCRQRWAREIAESSAFYAGNKTHLQWHISFNKTTPIPTRPHLIVPLPLGAIFFQTTTSLYIHLLVLLRESSLKNVPIGKGSAKPLDKLLIKLETIAFGSGTNTFI